MSYFCLEELQVDLDLYALDKIDILSKVGSKYDDGWFVITDDGYCHLFDNDGNLDDIGKIKKLEEKHIKIDTITKIIIPDSVTSIGDYAFYGCRGLTSMTIPDSVTSIGSVAFRYCSGLTSVTIGDAVTSIGRSAFSNCRGLTNVTIGNSMANIRKGAFYNCNKLINMTFKGKTLEQVKKMNNYSWGIKDESIIKVE